MENRDYHKELWSQFESLPHFAQQEVADFVAFLAKRYEVHAEDDLPPFRDEEFVGIWKDRKDLEDSTMWVKKLRAEEWGP